MRLLVEEVRFMTHDMKTFAAKFVQHQHCHTEDRILGNAYEIKGSVDARHGHSRIRRRPILR
jgi:hypothetical protein